ncbi:MAG: N-acetylmuramoyl-L-alanine amidase [Actinobacteria bacterium]|nr:N-acetylmuramoyl-L-alanine amidase [Actinomycetota bacterium]MBU1943666.1 N-acetylmuramoyl-L-alanine amidase [Actinomycetota bacterium]MBU2686190.1 N-acetylmuramoyl-L-alanine amidase [Actinomycetota bacterium]
MDEEITPGHPCIITRDVMVGDRLAFARGESVVVERAVPNAERPQFRYVTYSPRLNLRFQLSDAEIRRLEPAPVPAVRPVGAARGLPKGFWIAVASAASALVLVTAGVVAWIATRGTPGSPGTGEVVCIDPGHGARDTGALENGVAEKDVNLDIALRARRLLEEKGYRVVLTRDSDTNPSLAERCAIANGSGASVFVSIHNNARPPDVRGTTTYHFRDSTDGRLLAVYLQQEVVRSIERPDRGTRGSRLYVVANVSMPAALLEAVFLTDPDEAALIKDPDFRERVAEGVAAGVEAYLKSVPEPE